MASRPRALSVEECLVGAAFLGLTALACLMPVHNDTWWHLRSGQEMVQSRALLFTDRFSFTAANSFFWNHSWLAQIIFYGVFTVGGLPALTAFCAVLAVAAWAVQWRMTHGDVATRLIVLGIALSSATAIWSVRPQVFSIVLLTIAAKLAAEDRWAVLAVLMVLWANLHAGFAMGLVIAIAACVAALISDRDRLLGRVLGTTACAAATLITPLGTTNWTEMFASMARSRANQIHEWMPPGLSSGHLIFWLAAGALVWLAASRWRRLAAPADRVIVLSALAAIPLGARSIRNIPAFMILMLPAMTRLLSVGERPTPKQAPQPSRSATTILAFVSCAAAGLVVMAWRLPWTSLGWQPMSRQAATAIASCPAPLYNSYEGGGPIIWFVPSQRVFLDSRQDPFPITLVQAATRVEATGDYKALFDRFRFQCAALAPGTPTAVALQRDGWRQTFIDRRWVVLIHPSASLARPDRGATTRPGPTGS